MVSLGSVDEGRGIGSVGFDSVGGGELRLVVESLSVGRIGGFTLVCLA
jgi:hypothetical protein